LTTQYGKIKAKNDNYNSTLGEAQAGFMHYKHIQGPIYFQAPIALQCCYQYSSQQFLMTFKTEW